MAARSRMRPRPDVPRALRCVSGVFATLLRIVAVLSPPPGIACRAGGLARRRRPRIEWRWLLHSRQYGVVAIRAAGLLIGAVARASAAVAASASPLRRGC